MALKLGKCRLCLKLGDFYSIFTEDNAVQLADMVMECTRVKIYDGDGLPDKVCSECIQKLSSAYIFKQQCERSDEELRRNYVPPPGFSVSPVPQNRKSSDSAFSNNTSFSSSNKQSSNERKLTPPSRTRKRSRESVDNVSTSSRDYRPGSSKRVDELREKKRPRVDSPNISMDSDFEDNVLTHFSDVDSDEPLAKPNQCKLCDKSFESPRSLAQHNRIHKNKILTENAVVNIPKKSINDANDVEDKLKCEKCDKTFKLQIMLKRHLESCGKKPVLSPQKELLITLEPIDRIQYIPKLQCQICAAKFNNADSLEKHAKTVHPSIHKSKLMRPFFPCLYCRETFDDYYLHSAHFNSCSKRQELDNYECPACKKVMARKANYFKHIKDIHFDPKVLERTPESRGFDCRFCSKSLDNEEQLITHLAAHVARMEEADTVGADEESRASTLEDSASQTSNYSTARSSYNCTTCDKQFKYRKSYVNHTMTCCPQNNLEVKAEPPDKTASTSLLQESYVEPPSDSGSEGDDNTCDICEKQFSYKRLLLQHKRTKHNMSSGHKRSTIVLKNCPVRCRICDLDMKVSDINAHNQQHIKNNLKPRNIYSCTDCTDQFKSCSALANHIKLVHRLKQQPAKQAGRYEPPNPADFCEVVVTKTEPLESFQSHNGGSEVPSGEHTCPVCGKTMPTVLSLQRHVNWHTNVGNHIEKKIECFVCKETFRFKGHYRLHMGQHYKDPNLDPVHLTCSICKRRSKNLRAAQAHMNFHKQTRFKNKDYQCSICKRVFQDRRVYLQHMTNHQKRGESLTNVVIGDHAPGAAGAHTCSLCGKACDSAVSLKHHMTWHRSKSSLYAARHECPLCGLQFTNKKRCDLHVRTHYEDDAGPYKCNVCGKGYIDESYFKRHVKGHNFDHQSHTKRLQKLRKDKVKCPICSRLYPDLVKLIRHLRFMHPESKMIKEDPDAPPPSYFSCKLCAKIFLDERALLNHQERHKRTRALYRCKFCFKSSMSIKAHNIHIKSHLTRNYIDDPLKCSHCEERFVKGYHLHYHLRDVHGIEETWLADGKRGERGGPLQELQCAVCLKVLASRGNYERHLDYHSLLRCNYCFQDFSTLKFLEGHLAFNCEKKKLIGDTEVYPKKTKCEVCYKAFHLQVKLDCHLRTQHGIRVSRVAAERRREIVCDYCFRVFENEDALASHKIYHRTIGYYGCIYCSRKFNTLTLYNKHKNHHFSQLNVDNPTKCEHCEETFVAFREMIYHMKDVHGDDKEWVVMPKESVEETCPICNKTFFNLHRHMDYHEENRCKKCKEYFYSRNDYDSHLCSIESDEETDRGGGNTDEQTQYEECSFCFKGTTKKNSKRLHNQIHNGSGAISCRFCVLKFKTMDAFNIHAFTHRSRKYNKKPLKCRECGETFVRYGPFTRHLREVHKCTQKMHYRAKVLPEPCVVCGDEFPNLHNHYRAHLQNQCQLCRKYFTSARVFSLHECDKEDSDPTKVFSCDENLIALINSYVPKDIDKSNQKYYGHSDDEDSAQNHIGESNMHDGNETNAFLLEDESQNSMDFGTGQSPVISDVLSLYQKENDTEKNDVVNLLEDTDSQESESIVALD